MEAKKSVLVLKEACLAKHEATLSRVLEALQIMKDKGLPQSFQSVAKFAGVSKTWLYSMPEIRRKIEESRSKSNTIKRNRDLHELLEKKEAEISILVQKIKKYEATVNKLRLQLEVAYGELYKRNND